MNDEETSDKPMFQYGANDDFKQPGPDGPEQMGRQPEPDEKYLISEPDATTRVAEDTEQLTQYYADKGIPWPYNG